MSLAVWGPQATRLVPLMDGLVYSVPLAHRGAQTPLVFSLPLLVLWSVPPWSSQLDMHDHRTRRG